MARKRYSTDEIIKHLRTLEIERASGTSLEAASKKIGVSSITLTHWQKEFGGLRVDQAKKLKDLEKENTRLKRLLANAELFTCLQVKSTWIRKFLEKRPVKVSYFF